MKGFAHLLLILFILGGLVFGVYLVGQRTNLFSRAFNPDKTIDQLTQELVRLNQTRVAAGNEALDKSSKMLAVASLRQGKLIKLLEQNPESFLNEADLISQRGNFPKDIQGLIEEEKQLTGDLVVKHYDYFDKNNSTTNYQIDKINLYFPKEAPGLLANNKNFEASVVSIGDQAAVKDLKLVGREALENKPAVGRKKIAAFIIRNPDWATPSASLSEIEEIIFTGQHSVKDYFERISEDRLSIEGEVFDNFVLEDQGKNCNDDNWVKEVEKQAKNRGINPNDYDYRYFINTSEDDCSYGGVAFDQSRMVIAASSQSVLSIYVHELGHLLNLAHANSFYCGEEAFKHEGECNYVEYGDPHDVMGSYFSELNGPHRYKLGWLDESNIKVISSRVDSIETIELPLETKGGGLKLIRILGDEPSDKDYYIEYRQPVGKYFSSFSPDIFQGVLIHSAWRYSLERTIYWMGSYLYDNNPDSKEGFIDSFLSDGKSFFDPYRGLKITQLSHDFNSVQIKIEFVTQQVTPTPPYIPEWPDPSITPPKVWSVNTKAICQDGSDPTDPAGKHAIRGSYAIWPKINYDLNSPLSWSFTEYNKLNTFLVTSGDEINNIYIKAEDREGRALEPSGDNLPQGIEKGQFFNPPTWMVRWKMTDLNSSPLLINFRAPDDWCK